MDLPRRRWWVAPCFVVAVAVSGACSGGSEAATSSTSGPTPVTPPSAPAPAAVTAPASSLPDGIQAAVPVGQGPITLAATDAAIWVELHRANIVSKVDPATNREVAQFSRVPAHCAVAVGDGYAWASKARVGLVSKIEPDSGEVVDELRVPEACGLAVDDHYLWVTSPTGVARFDPDTLAERATVELGELVFGIALGSDAVWAQGESGGGTVWRIDPATNAVTAEIAAPGASAIAVGFDSVWVAARDRAVVHRIDPATNSVAATIELPGPIGGIGVGLEGVWVSGFGDGWVSRIDPDTGQVTGSISTGYVHLGPPITAFGSVWVAALDENVLLRIDPSAVTDTR
jgi:DNA-binding beta-propeller fold protein YncE